MNVEQLRVLQNTANIAERRIDIKGITPTISGTALERAEHYLAQIKNPYAFQCGNVRVNVAFSPDDNMLVQTLERYLSSRRE